MTAVIVAHDGVTWLPGVADALLDQTRAVQRVVAVDTGSRDRSGAVLASKFGQTAVFGMDRSTGYGAAVARALHHRAANLPMPGGPGASHAERVEWLWLLHDDCEPAPDALEQLLRGAAETNAAAVLGPKLRDWSNREVIVEAGVSLDTAARRLTGVEPREVDQGQHDGDRDALAVCSAGMLVRRDVWEQVGGFDATMGLFMEDVDFCWRVHAAGYRVRVITDAVCYHARAAAKHRRTISIGRRARMLDRRNGLLTLLGNLPLRQMVTAAIGNVVVSLLRIAFFVLAKRLTAALDEAAAVTSVLCHPIRLLKMRRRRARGRRAAYSRVKAELPPGHSSRRLFEFAASTMMKSAQTDTAGSHHASVDPTEDDSMLVDNGLGKRLLTSPALLAFIVLTVIAIFAGRSLIGGGPLGGGSLVPAWEGASDLWRTYLQSFHPAGLGSTTSAPPYLAVLAVLATVLAGKPWLAIDVLLIGCVPLAGMSAMLAARRITTNPAVRVWASVSYALLPVATGIVAGGRFGSAVVFILLPLIALHAGRIVVNPGQRASRAAWAAGLLVAIGAAFVPMLWLIALVGCIVAAIVVRTTIPGVLRNLAIVALITPVLLIPWTLTVAAQPASLLLEAGLPQSGPTGLSGKMLLLLDPGGPGLPPYWITGGLIAAALAALFAGRRRRLITAGWGAALSGLLLAILVSHLVVTPPDGGPVTTWAGLPLALAALGLLTAACTGGDALGRVLAGGKGRSSFTSGRGVWVGLIALIACSAPVLAAVSWLGTGVNGPVHQVSTQVVPELVAVADGQSRQVRTLVLREVDGHISYLLLRGPSPSLGDPELVSPPDARQALAKAVATLISPDGGLAADQGQLLADFDIGYVLVQPPVTQQLSSLLDDVGGLQPYSTTSSYSIWALVRPPARVTVVEPNGTVVPVASGVSGVSGAAVPVAGGILMLAEPSGGWNASVDGHALTPVPSPAGSWAQAFRLPPGGGKLDLGHSGLIHDLWLILEALLLVAAIGLALPGIGLAEDAERADAASAGASDEGQLDRPQVPQQRQAAMAGAGARGGGSRGGDSWEDPADAAPGDLDAADEAPADDRAGSVRAGRVAAAGVAGVAAARVARAGSRGGGGRGGSGSRGKGSQDRDTAKEGGSRGGPSRGGGVRGRGKPGRGRSDSARAADDRLADDRLSGDRLSDDRLSDDRLADDRLADDRSSAEGARGRRGRTGPDDERSGYAARPASGPTGRDDDADRTRAWYDDDRSEAGQPSRAGGSRLADAWPHADGRDDDRRAAQAPAARAWPYQAEPGPSSTGPSSTGPSSTRPSSTGLPGASPLNIGPSSTGRRADWGSDVPERPAPAGRPTGRSPSGAPPPQWTSAEPGRAEIEPYQRGRYEQDSRQPDSYEGASRSYDPPSPERTRDSERPHRAGSPYPPEQPHRAEQAYRPEQSYRAEQPHRAEQPYRGEQPLGAEQPHRAAQPYRADPPYTDGPAPRDRQDRWGRRGDSDDGYSGHGTTGPGQSARPARSPSGHLESAGQLEPLPGWPSAGGDALEPLPPAGGQAGGSSGRASAWRPDNRDADYRDPDVGHPYGAADWESDDRDNGERWPERQPGNEGETW